MESLRAYEKRSSMELEMFLNGKFIDAMSITEKDLENIHELQHKLEKKHCHQLQYTDGQPQFFVSGLSEEEVQQ